MIQHEVSKLGLERFEVAKEVCCDYWGVDSNVVFTKTRKREVVNARHSIRFMLTSEDDFSLAEIGGLTNCDHTSVIHSRKTFLNLSDCDEDFRCLYNKINVGNKIRSKALMRRKIGRILNSNNLELEDKKDSLYKLIKNNTY
jgi:hypothetical protein